MALTANRTDWKPRAANASIKFAARIKDASVLYFGALCSFDTETGLIKPYDGTEADALAGWFVGGAAPKTGATSDSSPPEAELETGPFIWHDLEVGGLSGTYATDLGKRVWATDDGTYTTTDPGSTGTNIGIVVRPISSSKAAVLFRRVTGYVDVFSVLPTPSPTPSPTPTPTPSPTPTPT
jgi:hypothetical protein